MVFHTLLTRRGSAMNRVRSRSFGGLERSGRSGDYRGNFRQGLWSGRTFRPPTSRDEEESLPFGSQRPRRRRLSSWTELVPSVFSNLSFWGGSGYVLKSLHGVNGSILPYWACISITNVTVRTSLLPLVVSGARTSVKFASVAPEVQFLVSLYLKESAVLKEGGAPPAERRRHFMMNFSTLRRLYHLHGVNPLAVFRAPLLQLPVFWYFAVDLRRIINGGQDPDLANDLSEGGLLWFTNLTEPDPWFVLPVLSGLLLYGNVELAMGPQSLSGQTTSKSNMAVLLKDAFQTLSIFIPSFMAGSPAGTQIYLATTFVFTLGQSAALRNDAVRALVGLPALTGAVKPEAKLAQEFTKLVAREKEATERRQQQQQGGEADGNTFMTEVRGKGTVLAPGFVGSMETGKTVPSSIDVTVPKPTMLRTDDARTRPSEIPTVMPHVPPEVMEAANRGEPMPKPIVMAPQQTRREAARSSRVVDGKELAKSLKKKKASNTKSGGKNKTGRRRK